jgi:hypothetical protein
MGTCVWQILTIIDHWLVAIWGRTLPIQMIVKCHGNEMAICRWILYDELKWLNSLLAKAIRHARHVLKSVCDWLWAFQMCVWTKICVPQLVGGLEHVLFFHDIWDNPSHWQLTNIFQRGWNHQPAIFAWFHISNYPGDGHKLFPKTGRGQTPGVRGANLRCNSITQCRRVDGVGHGLASIVLGQNIRICWCVK